jgi:L-2,4-diaminobutyrate decarboxylase
MTLLNPTVTLEDIKILLALVESTAQSLIAA